MYFIEEVGKSRDEILGLGTNALHDTLGVRCLCYGDIEFTYTKASSIRTLEVR